MSQPVSHDLNHLLDALQTRVASTFNTEYERAMARKYDLIDAYGIPIEPSDQAKVTHGGWESIYLAVRAIGRLGRPWGIRDEQLFRQTMRDILEKNFGVQVRKLNLRREQFDCLIVDGQHILVEIAASVGPDVQKRLERKRQLYSDETGITPARFILAVGSIHSRRAEALRAAGFDVIEPEEGTES